MAHTYDGAGHALTVTYPNGKKVSNAYDGAGNLIAVTDWLGNETTFGYDRDGNVITETTGKHTRRGIAAVIGPEFMTEPFEQPAEHIGQFDLVGAECPRSRRQDGPAGAFVPSTEPVREHLRVRAGLPCSQLEHELRDVGEVVHEWRRDPQCVPPLKLDALKILLPTLVVRAEMDARSARSDERRPRELIVQRCQQNSGPSSWAPTKRHEPRIELIG